MDRNFRAGEVERPQVVALRKESVDRNPIISLSTRVLKSRSPQGERG